MFTLKQQKCLRIFTIRRQILFIGYELSVVVLLEELLDLFVWIDDVADRDVVVDS